MVRMRCPVCGKQAIGFYAWGQGINAVRTQCRHCGAKLRANKVVIWGFVITAILVLATVAVVVFLMPRGVNDRPYRFLAVVPPTLVCSAIVYWLGGYERREK